jgi:CDP-diacylglycerol pyrophosphatase
MNWFTRLFRRKQVQVAAPVEVESVNPFKVLAESVTGERSNRLQELESGLLTLRGKFNNRQLLLFKTLCILYTSEQLKAETFQDFVDRIEGEFANLEVDDVKRHMIAAGIGHESNVL